METYFVCPYYSPVPSTIFEEEDNRKNVDSITPFEEPANYSWNTIHHHNYKPFSDLFIEDIQSDKYTKYVEFQEYKELDNIEFSSDIQPPNQESSQYTVLSF